MTEKRFTLEEFGLNFIVNDNGRNLTAKQTVDRLNELFDENEQLKQRLDTYDKGCKELYNDKKRLEKENEQLKQQEKRLYKYFRKCFENVSEQAFSETWEVVKNND